MRFVMSRHDGTPGPERVWIMRPDSLRVEPFDDDRVIVNVVEPATVSLLTAGYRPSRRPGRRQPRRREHGTTTRLRYPSEASPVLGSDGLVRERPSDRDVDYDAPNYASYYGVAVLDPVELADADRLADSSTRAPVVIEELEETTHHGRNAWEAVLRPTASYTPRCHCCALLLSAEVMPSLEIEPGFRYPDATRVRLDVETGVCVWLEQIGGSRAGWGHDLRIEAVDEPMPDELFRRPRRGWLRRLWPGR